MESPVEYEAELSVPVRATGLGMAHGPKELVPGSQLLYGARRLHAGT